MKRPLTAIATLALVAGCSAPTADIAVSGPTRTTVHVSLDAWEATTTTTTTTTRPPRRRAAPPAPRPARARAPQPATAGCGGWRQLIAAHFPPEQVGNACAVMVCESNGNPSAVSHTNDHGLTQIHYPLWEKDFRRVTGADFFPGVYDPGLNIQFAHWLWSRSGWQPWVCRKVL